MKFEKFSQIMGEIRVDRKWHKELSNLYDFFKAYKLENNHLNLIYGLEHKGATKDKLKEYLLKFSGASIDAFLDRYSITGLSKIEENNRLFLIALENRIKDTKKIFNKISDGNIDTFINKLFENNRDDGLDYFICSESYNGWKNLVYFFPHIIRYYQEDRLNKIIKSTCIYNSTLKDAEVASDTVDLFVPHYEQQNIDSILNISADGSLIKIQDIDIYNESDVLGLYRLIENYQSLEKKALRRYHQSDSINLEDDLAQYFRLIKEREIVKNNFFIMPNENDVTSDILSLGGFVNATLNNKLASIKVKEACLAKKLKDYYGIVNVVLDNYVDDDIWGSEIENLVSFVWGTVKSYNKNNLIIESTNAYNNYVEKKLKNET